MRLRSEEVAMNHANLPPVMVGGGCEENFFRRIYFIKVKVKGTGTVEKERPGRLYAKVCDDLHGLMLVESLAAQR